MNNGWIFKMKVYFSVLGLGVQLRSQLETVFVQNQSIPVSNSEKNPSRKTQTFFRWVTDRVLIHYFLFRSPGPPTFYFPWFLSNASLLESTQHGGVLTPSVRGMPAAWMSAAHHRGLFSWAAGLLQPEFADWHQRSRPFRPQQRHSIQTAGWSLQARWDQWGGSEILLKLGLKSSIFRSQPLSVVLLEILLICCEDIN